MNQGIELQPDIFRSSFERAFSPSLRRIRQVAPKFDLLARDDAVVVEPMDRRGRDAEGDRGALDGHELAVGSVGLRYKAWDTQVGHSVALEAVTFCRSAPLSIEDAGDHPVASRRRQRSARGRSRSGDR